MITKKHLLSALCIAFFMVIGIASSDSDSNESSESESKTATKNEAAAEQTKPKSNWTYSNDEDKMNGTKQYFAKSVSTNKIKFEFPYNGGSEFYLIVRNLGKSNEILLRVSKGQFMTSISSSENCRVKFDDDQPMTVGYNMPTDASSDLIFLDSSAKLLTKLKTAKKVMIEAPFYNAGRQIAEFNVEGLEWDK